LKLDSTDIRIIETLMKDGRASFRKVATKTNLTVPTVSNHFSKIMKTGLITRFVPLFDLERLEGGVVSFVRLKVPYSSFKVQLSTFKKVDEVKGVYITAERLVILKVNMANVRELEKLLSRIAAMGCEVIESVIISNTLKDEQPFILRDNLILEAKCDFCGGPITSEKPYNIKVKNLKYLFCCRTCRSAYIEKNRKRLERLRSA
jgi:DNA-binding Lrp family transcriptional regulator